jgi:threonine dehydratase
MVNFSDIVEASNRIKSFAKLTPILTNRGLNSIFGCELYFKCENFQKVGAFKFRGALNSVLALEPELLGHGVATHSSGNHAAALALAASLKSIPAYIVMPENSPEVKKKAVIAYNANVSYCKPTLQAREDKLNEVVASTGAYFIHPFNNEMVIAGQGTSALEFITDIPDLNVIIAPVGGGGLLSGTAISARTLKPEIQIIGAEPKGADDAYRSLLENRVVASVNPLTIADGLLTSLGSITFPIIKQYVNEIICVNETSIKFSLRLILERMKILVEPSSAVALATLVEKPDFFKNKKVGIILSGGNIELDRLSEYL